MQGDFCCIPAAITVRRASSWPSVQLLRIREWQSSNVHETLCADHCHTFRPFRTQVVTRSFRRRVPTCTALRPADILPQVVSSGPVVSVSPEHQMSRPHRTSKFRHHFRPAPRTAGWSVACLLGVIVAATGAGRPAVSATEPMAVINEQIEARWKDLNLGPAPLCDDRTFVRRVYLDLAGRIPTVQEADAFVADAGTGKRTLIVDHLIASPEYARHMRDVFDVVLIGRKTGRPQFRRRGMQSGGGDPGWGPYLERVFSENRPWDQFMADILVARPKSDTDQGAVWFLFDKGERYQEIAEAISPAVFGIQIQCAQCHDHPLAGEVKQAHYWGLVAFFNRTKNQTTGKGPRLSESAIGGFSNFATLSGQSHPAELSFLGVETVPETRPAADQKEEDKPELYRPAGAMDEPKVPVVSRRELFVDKVVRGNTRVAKAAVNRFWALLLGRGLVHPVDKMDSAHPPSHPELLELLAKDFADNGYNIKRLVRAIVLSRPYQLDSRRPAQALPESFAYGLEKPLTAEALYRSLLVASTGKSDSENPELLRNLADVFPDVFVEESLTSLRQTMFITNNAVVQKLVRAGDGNMAERLVAMADPAARVRAAFRGALQRDPDPEELQQAVAYLIARPDRARQATEQFWWALLAGPEFRFNH